MQKEKRMKEPIQKKEINQSELLSMLSWYNVNNGRPSVVKSYLLDWLMEGSRSLQYGNVKKLPDSSIEPTVGYIARILSNGSIIPEITMKSFDDCLKDLSRKGYTFEKPVTPTVDREKKVTMVPRIMVDQRIGDVEHEIDKFIINDCHSEFSMFKWLMGHNIKSVDAKGYITIFQDSAMKILQTIEEPIDKEILDNYTNLNKSQRRRYHKFLMGIVDDCLKYIDAIKKPRTRKVKTNAELTSKVQYCAEYTDNGLSLKSETPENIIGATQLWVYNTKTRYLSGYYGLNGSGIQIQGTTIKNYNELSSLTKKLRNPQQALSVITTPQSVENIFKQVTTKPRNAPKRLNSDTVIVGIQCTEKM